jgi:hypothetical protein
VALKLNFDCQRWGSAWWAKKLEDDMKKDRTKQSMPKGGGVNGVEKIGTSLSGKPNRKSCYHGKYSEFRRESSLGEPDRIEQLGGRRTHRWQENKQRELKGQWRGSTHRGVLKG